jgi:hypothetical protein
VYIDIVKRNLDCSDVCFADFGQQLWAQVTHDVHQVTCEGRNEGMKKGSKEGREGVETKEEGQ